MGGGGCIVEISRVAASIDNVMMEFYSHSSSRWGD